MRLDGVAKNPAGARTLSGPLHSPAAPSDFHFSLFTLRTQLHFLGTGTSAGVPMIGCPCAVCTSDDPRDRRDRCSVVVTWDDPAVRISEKDEAVNPDQAARRQVLIDTSPDLRHQALRARLSRLDAVMITHAHADHVMGMDDLRRFTAAMDGPLEVYAEPPVHAALGRMFEHIFHRHRNVNDSFVASLSPLALTTAVPFALYGATWTPVRLMHGRLPVHGFRIDRGGASLAYCTDVSSIPPESYALLQGLDVLVIDGLRPRHHPTHLSTDQALDVVAELQPKRAYLTHLAHDESHAELAARLPAGVEPAYDGLVVPISDL